MLRAQTLRYWGAGKDFLRRRWRTKVPSSAGALQVFRGLGTSSGRGTSTPEDEGVAIPQSADAVVVGGGVIGCSVLYHLASLGLTNVVLLERNKITSGTTWHTAGLFHMVFATEAETHVVARTRELQTLLTEETGVQTGVSFRGSIDIAENEGRLKYLKRLNGFGKALGLETRIITPSEIKDLNPLLHVDDIAGGIYEPVAGNTDPTGYTTALLRAAKRRGAQVVEHCPVNHIHTCDDLFGGRKVTGVTTPQGHIQTDCVVNATGAWACALTANVGVSIPYRITRHMYIITEPIQGVINAPDTRDFGSRSYLRVTGDALKIGGFEANPTFVEKVDPEFAFGLWEMEWDVFEPLLAGAVHRMPVLEKTGIRSTICGPESFTPDHKPVFGEDPNIRGFFHATNFNSSGMQMSGGAGEQLAHWVISGRPRIDLAEWDVRRLQPKLVNNRKWLEERTHEQFAARYNIKFPHDQNLAARNLFLDPLHEELQNLGGVFEEKAGWERVAWYEPETPDPAPVQPYDFYGFYDTPLNTDKRYLQRILQEYSWEFSPVHERMRHEALSCRERVALFNVTMLGKFYVTGAQAQEALDWFCTADVTRPAGTIVYTLALNSKGGIEADFTVSIVEGSSSNTAIAPAFEGRGFYLCVSGAHRMHFRSHLLQQLRQNALQDVEIQDVTEDIVVLALQGPKSRHVLRQVTQDDLSDESFPVGSHRVIKIGDHDVRAIRVTYVGELGWELHMPNNSATEVFRTLRSAGEPHGLALAGYRTLESLACEKGYRHWPDDIKLIDTPLEAGMGFACKLKRDTAFQGRNVLECQKEKGLTKKLMTFTVNDPGVPLWGKEAIYKGNDIVGYIRRAEYAFALGRSIAHGYVSRPDGGVVTRNWLKENRDPWRLESLGQVYDVTAHVTLPFDPTNRRVKGFYE